MNLLAEKLSERLNPMPMPVPEQEQEQEISCLVSVSKDGNGLRIHFPLDCKKQNTYSLEVFKAQSYMLITPDPDGVKINLPPNSNRVNLCFGRNWHGFPKEKIMGVSGTIVHGLYFPSTGIIKLDIPEFKSIKKKVKKVTEEIEEKQPEKKTSQMTTEPIYIRKLYDGMRNGRIVGDMIGCSGGTITNAVNSNVVSLSYELAAENIYNKKYNKETFDAELIVGVLNKEVLKGNLEFQLQEDGRLGMIRKEVFVP